MGFHPPGTRIAGRYEAAGWPLVVGMSIVYLCFDHQKQRPVALKIFRPEFLPDQVVQDRSLRKGIVWVNPGCYPYIVRCRVGQRRAGRY